MPLRRRILEHLRGRLADAPPPLRLVFWDGDIFDFVPAPAVILTIHSPRIVRMLATGDMEGLGDAYVSGDITVEGRIQNVLHMGVALAERIGRFGPAARLAPLLAHLPRRHHTRKRDAASIRHHYDVSNEFYALWLDRRMVYSCAYFRTGAEDLDTAQEQKLEHICRKLRLAPGERVLDLGCGWGGLLRWAASRYGVTGVGVTLSERQFAFARERVAAEGLADRIEIRLQDYRDVPGEACFDKIVSVGMYEHVGLANLPVYFGAIRRLLKAGGAVLNHGITAADPDGRAKGPPGGGFIDRYVFPGGELPHLSRVIYEASRAGLEVADVEDMRPHYARTLQHWVRRLEVRAREAEAAAGAERYRIWRMFMAAMAFAFDRGWLSVAQVLAYKPFPDRMAARPLTREYQYGAAAPVLATPLDWSLAPASPRTGRHDPGFEVSSMDAAAVATSRG